MFVNLQPLNSPQRETAKKVYSKAPPSPELTIEYVRLRNDDDEVTDPERLENYIKTLRAESEAKKKQSRVDDVISTDELAENDDATDVVDNRSLEEVRRRTASWESSPIQRRFSDSPRHPAVLSKPPLKHESVTDSSPSASTPEQQTKLRRFSRKRKKVEYRSVNLSSSPERPETSRQSRQKKVSRRTINTRTIGTQTVV